MNTKILSTRKRVFIISAVLKNQRNVFPTFSWERYDKEVWFLLDPHSLVCNFLSTEFPGSDGLTKKGDSLKAVRRKSVWHWFWYLWFDIGVGRDLDMSESIFRSHYFFAQFPIHIHAFAPIFFLFLSISLFSVSVFVPFKDMVSVGQISVIRTWILSQQAKYTQCNNTIRTAHKLRACIIVKGFCECTFSWNYLISVSVSKHVHDVVENMHVLVLMKNMKSLFARMWAHTRE